MLQTCFFALYWYLHREELNIDTMILNLTWTSVSMKTSMDLHNINTNMDCQLKWAGMVKE